MKISFDQIRTMRYGIHSIGTHVHVKLRYTAELADRMLTDNELRPYMNDLTVMFNKTRTHAHIVFIAHQNAGLVQLLYRVEQRQRAKLAIEKANRVIESQV